MPPRQKLKIAFVVPGTDFAGPERQVLHLVRRLDPRRYAASVISLHEPGELAVKIQHAGAIVHGIDLERGPTKPSPARRLLALRRLVTLLKQIDPDIVQVVGDRAQVMACVAARIAGVPVIIGMRRAHPVGGAWRRRDRAAARRCDLIVTPSAALAADVRSGLVFPQDDVAVIPTAVDFGDVRGKERPAEYSEPRLRIGSMARLEPDSGIEAIIAAAAALKVAQVEFEWLVLGSSDDPVPWVRAAQRAGVEREVRLLGERGGVGGWFSALDVFVAASPRSTPGAGTLEAMAAGVAVIAVTGPSVTEFVRDGVEAVIVPDARPQSLADAILRVVGDGVLGERLRSGAQSLVETRFRIEEATIAWHDVWERLVARAATRG